MCRYVDAITLAQKMVKRIDEYTSLSYSQLQQRAQTLGIVDTLFDAAIDRLHKSKHIVKKVRGSDIIYSIKKESAPSPMSHVEWCSDNYPRYDTNCYTSSGQFIMAFPEWDLSFMFLTPEEMQKFKAEQKGMAFVRRRKYEHTRR